MIDDQKDKLEPLLQEKLQAYKDFLTATLLLQEALEKEEMPQVTRLLAERDILAGKVDRLDQQLSHYEQVITIPLPTADRHRQAKITDVIAEILKSIVAANDACDSQAANRCAEMKHELLMMRQKEAGLHGYGAQPQRLPVFLNVKT